MSVKKGQKLYSSKREDFKKFLNEGGKKYLLHNYKQIQKAYGKSPYVSIYKWMKEFGDDIRKQQLKE